MRLRKPWQLYDALIDLVPSDVTVTDAILSRVALVGNSAGGVGTASRDASLRHAKCDDRVITGWSLREAAALVKSWDFERASLGVAAINSWLNTPANLEAVGSGSWNVEISDANVFDAWAAELAGAKVALIGHFTQGVKALEGVTELTVLERVPRPGDLPDTAAEFVLPAMDCVFITGMTLANKTLPRLLELSANARVYLTGPSVPCAPEVFRDVACIASSYVRDPELARSLVAVGASTPEVRPATTRFQVYA